MKIDIQLIEYLVLSRVLTYLTIFILFFIIAWVVGLNEKGKFILAVAHIIAVTMTFFAFVEMETVTPCNGDPVYADPVKCALILLPPWLITCLVHLWINKKNQIYQYNQNNDRARIGLD